nr:uncharacterized protein LOC133598380 [Nerophis lumbriciformis]
MSIQTGDKIPAASFKTPTTDGPRELTSGEIFSGKKVVLFAVPGAFTPTCSDAHLPGFIVRSDEILAKGVDTIACTSVNDVFVMGAWAKDKHLADGFLMLADGNGDFAKAAGLELDLEHFGMGKRSKRYAMIVDDGTVTYLGVEPAGDVGVSGAEAVLEEL